MEPKYQPDVQGMAEDLRRAHGRAAVDIAIDTVHQHMQDSAWKHCALWLQVVNRLNAAEAPSAA